MMYNQNVERFLKYLGWENIPENVKDLEEQMNEISEESKRILEIRWGLLNDEKICMNFKTLNKKLGVENSKEVYKGAMREFMRNEYVRVLKDSEKFEKEMAFNLGLLAKTILEKSELKKNSIIGTELIKSLYTLNVREKKVITKRFGLVLDYERKSLDEVAKEMDVTLERVKQLETKALRKLRHASRRKDFDVEFKEQHQKAQQEKYENINQIDSTVNIIELELTVRTYNCLVRGGIKTVGQFLNLTREDLKTMKNIGIKCMEEVETIREKMGMPLE